jgi:DNA modification methylase
LPDFPVLIGGDCRGTMAALAMAGEKFDSIVCDPPYDLISTVRRFGKPGSAPAKSNGATGVYARASKGFMGKLWDGTGIAFDPETWRLAYECLKPGGHLIAFGGTRTSHRMTCAIEDAGFEIRDSVYWIYGSGFPKSHNVSKGIDKAAGATRSVGRERVFANGSKPRATARDFGVGDLRERNPGHRMESLSATIEAELWDGWGTALKPAVEPITLARKPLAATVAGNMTTFGTGGLNIGACMIPGAKPDTTRGAGGKNGRYAPVAAQERILDDGAGRHPANLIHDGSPEVIAMFPETKSGKPGIMREGRNNGACFGAESRAPGTPMTGIGDSGSAARFFASLGFTEHDPVFYCPKAKKSDRAGSGHPTIKPLALMRWLCTLVTQPGGRILDPFAGSGTTLQAAYECGFSAVGCEMDPQYQSDIISRLAFL